MNTQEFSDPPCTYWPTFYDRDAWYELLEDLTSNGDRKQYPITLFWKTYMQPRLVAFQGDPGVTYTYSNTTLYASSWHPSVLQIKSSIENETGFQFNSVLLNQYRNGDDSMWRHADDEKELWDDPIIASVSIWMPRRCVFRRRDDKNDKFSLVLEHGSLLLMRSWCQLEREHAIPKIMSAYGVRINLTFRNIIVHA